MVQTELMKRISRALDSAKQPTEFCSAGEVSLEGAEVSIREFGKLRLPLSPAKLRELCRVASPAPFGQGERTLVDTEVRNTLEIDANDIELSAAFLQNLQTAAHSAADRMRIDKSRLTIEPYKLLIYSKGGFFLPHRDSEKRAGMVATMVVVLPSKYSGGELRICHRDVQTKVAFDKASRGIGAQFVVFFADCEHEVKKVTSGTRLCLTFNLVMEPKRRVSRGSRAPQVDAKVLAGVIDWFSTRPTEPLIFAMEHQYTADGLRPDLFKGADRELFEQLTAVSQAADCKLHLGQVMRHLNQFADDGSFGRSRYSSHRWSGKVSDLHIGEAYEDQVVVDGWKDTLGKKVKLEALNCNPSQLISAIPFEKWIPTQQDYEGYTGNAGNTLDRWYHKSALVLWPTSQHFHIVAQMGIQFAIAQFLQMTGRLESLKNDKREAAMLDCRRFAEAILCQWPDRTYQGAGFSDDREAAMLEFAVALTILECPQLIGQLARTIASRDPRLDLQKFVLASLKALGEDSVLPYLHELLVFEQKPNKYGVVFVEGLQLRDAHWLLKLCHKPDLLSVSSLSQLLDTATARLRADADKREGDSRSRAPAPHAAWLEICRACIVAGRNDELAAVLEVARTHPKLYDLRTHQVPALLKLRQESGKLGLSLPALENWGQWVRQQLQLATQRPTPPRDFSRRSDVGCYCEHCRKIVAFLEDPQLESTRIQAAEYLRGHMQSQLHGRQLDVDVELDRSRRPFGLLFKKNLASYERAVQQYETDLKLLASVDSSVD